MLDALIDGMVDVVVISRGRGPQEPSSSFSLPCGIGRSRGHQFWPTLGRKYGFRPIATHLKEKGGASGDAPDAPVRPSHY